VKPPFEWDPHSDQPRIIRDSSFKHKARLRNSADYLNLIGLTGAVLPLAFLKYPALKPTVTSQADIFGIGLSLDKGYQQLDLVEELGINHILLRIPLWDIRRLNQYAAFAKEACERNKSVLINLLQDRDHIDDCTLLDRSLNEVFNALAPFSNEFQIGNAINRIKWGFYSVKEYLNFFKSAQMIRDREFSQLQLLGPSVIDFEYFYTIRALFGTEDIIFDRLSSLLYVDRAGSPYARQLGVFDTATKVRLLGAIESLSKKVKHRGMYITEVNWPLSGTAPYAPTSEKECVSSDLYCQYMRDYFKIAQDSGHVARVYWHQLVSPGYGLVDSVDLGMKKTERFYALKATIQDQRTRQLYLTR
jgi:hypothetical protein